MTPKQLTIFLELAIRKKLPVLITGAPGVGKTAIGTLAARNAGADILFMHPVVSDPTDFKGLPAIVKDMAEFLPFGDLRRMIEADRALVVFIDDLGQAPASVQAAAMQLLLSRCLNGQRISDHVTFIAATNRHTDRAGVTGVLEPVKSRFNTIVSLEPDLDDFLHWCNGQGFPELFGPFLRFRPELLHNFKPTHELTNSACPRTLDNFATWLKLGVRDFEVLSGAAGEDVATQYLAFEEMAQTMPDPDAILADPAAHPAPPKDRLAVAYALCGALAARVTADTAENMFAYAAKLPQEFQALLVKDTLTKSPVIATTQAFIRWAAANHNRNFGGM